MKKLRIYQEPLYIFAMMAIALGVAMTAAANFGVSMIAAPAYILSLKISFLSFGQAEYIVQSFLLIVFCIVMRRFRPIWLFAFVCCLIYGLFLDLWRKLIPILNPNVTVPGDFALWLRIVIFLLGFLIIAFSVAMFFKVYFYPQVYDFFVKKVTQHYHLSLPKFKTGFDFSCLAAACAMTLLFFHGFRGIGIGTIFMTVLNGTTIGLASKLLDRCFVFPAIFPKLEEIFNKE